MKIKECKERLKKWDDGGIINTITLGGISPGYEQAIQILAIEMLRDILGSGKTRYNQEVLSKMADATATRLCKEPYSYGYSGAQVKVANWLALTLLKCGFKWIRDKHESDRMILCSKNFPKTPEN